MWTPYHRRPTSLPLYRRRIEDDNVAIPGFLLKKPETKVLHPENKLFDNDIEAGHASMQGYRVSMEDAHIIDHLPIKNHQLVAIMDGHAGDYAAHYVARNLKLAIHSTDEWKQYHDHHAKSSAAAVELLGKALLQAYLKLDEQLLEMTTAGIMDESGCTCVCAIITPTHFVCANVGDSRCVIDNGKSAISLTEDHKPENDDEKKRIMNGGGFVQFNRVNGELAMSRALGDFRYKRVADKPTHEQLVIPIPDIAIHERGSEDRVAVLACDGVWDVIANEESINFLTDIVYGEEEQLQPKSASKQRKRDSQQMSSGTSAQEAAENLIHLALQAGSQDNISAIVVKFPAFVAK